MILSNASAAAAGAEELHRDTRKADLAAKVAELKLAKFQQKHGEVTVESTGGDHTLVAEEARLRAGVARSRGKQSRPSAARLASLMTEAVASGDSVGAVASLLAAGPKASDVAEPEAASEAPPSATAKPAANEAAASGGPQWKSRAGHGRSQLRRPGKKKKASS
jgi:hypothetical protein